MTTVYPEWPSHPVKVFNPATQQWVTRPVRYHSTSQLAWLTGGYHLSTVTDFPLLETVPSSRVRSLFGVNVHLGWQWGPYSSNTATQDATHQAIIDLGASYFRDSYTRGGEAQQDIMIPRLLAAGVKYYAGLFGFDMTTGDMTAIVDDLVTRYPDPAQFEAVTGLNEPDDTGVDWQQHTTDLQAALWARFRSYPAWNPVPVVSPAMKLVDLTLIPDAGPYFDLAAIHHYPVAGKAFLDAAAQAQNFDYKVDSYKKVFPNAGITVDEYGTVTDNTVFPSASSSSVPEAVTAVYHPRAVCEAVRRNIRICMYELLDQSDRVTEFGGHFGLVDTSATGGTTDPGVWRRKQSFGSLARLIALTRDDGPVFTPAPLRAAVTGTPKTVALAKRTGEHGILHWRDELVYDGGAKATVTVQPVSQMVSFPVARTVTLTDVTTGAVTELGPVTRYTVPVAGNVIHARIV
jgi:hypothetical protein